MQDVTNPVSLFSFYVRYTFISLFYTVAYLFITLFMPVLKK
jgi:hypothetical protein